MGQGVKGRARTPRLDLAAVETGQSAASHQLRLLSNLGQADGRRTGRPITYALNDTHVVERLDQAILHADHRRLGVPDQDATGSTS